jgi:predicted DNA binding CopG/RHH family protein
MKKPIKIKKFNNEDKERDFWSKIDLSQCFEAQDFEHAIFPNLKPSSRSVSIRMPEYLLIRLKEKANELDVPYQTLLKQFVAQGLFVGEKKIDYKVKNSR